ncbi:hypothetical protein DH2020_003075 [Rehmannia glutinosa]|uniref:Myb/SANT-like domain-containing protein n=1 Tax=Rehmannia glutinosa TaxID=99300 RepID=A0ABR0XKI4_REHGL
MAPKYGLIQDDYIYDIDWMFAADNLFIEVLLDQQLIGNFKPECVNPHALLIAQDVVNKEFNKSFTYGYMEERLRVLKKQYQVFYWVLRKHGVRYDSNTNKVTAPEHVWDEIVQEYGDPNWPALQLLLGSSSTNFLPPNEAIIELSSDDETDHIDNIDGLPKRTINNDNTCHQHYIFMVVKGSIFLELSRANRTPGIFWVEKFG